MSRARVRTSPLSDIATILMLVLGLFTIAEVSFIIGLAIILLAAAMFFFSWWMRKRLAQPLHQGV